MNVYCSIITGANKSSCPFCSSYSEVPTKVDIVDS
ncbi:MAG: Sec23/Sec24 zinc finger-containing protein [Clostridia bacterium]|nr:Sec23/Sec24 zinc finger-containing protein [Clostridia bacterium]